MALHKAAYSYDDAVFFHGNFGNQRLLKIYVYSHTNIDHHISIAAKQGGLTNPIKLCMRSGSGNYSIRMYTQFNSNYSTYLCIKRITNYRYNTEDTWFDARMLYKKKQQELEKCTENMKEMTCTTTNLFISSAFQRKKIWAHQPITVQWSEYRKIQEQLLVARYLSYINTNKPMNQPMIRS